MRRVSYNDIAGRPWSGQSGLLDRMLPFVGNSMAAGWNLLTEDSKRYRLGRPYEDYDLKRQTREAVEEAARPGDRIIYVVWSYSTDVATYDPAKDESYVSPNYWGQTTGRHLGYAHRALPRVRSNAPSALDGIGPGSKVRYRTGNGRAWNGRVIETHPLAGAVRAEFYDEGGPIGTAVVPRGKVVLA